MIFCYLKRQSCSKFKFHLCTLKFFDLSELKNCNCAFPFPLKLKVIYRRLYFLKAIFKASCFGLAEKKNTSIYNNYWIVKGDKLPIMTIIGVLLFLT